MCRFAWPLSAFSCEELEHDLQDKPPMSRGLSIESMAVDLDESVIAEMGSSTAMGQNREFAIVRPANIPGAPNSPK